MKMTETLWAKARLEDCKNELERLGVKRLGLFGSIARADFQSESDVDVLVEFSDEVVNGDYYDRYHELLSFLQSRFGRRVDLVTEPGLKPAVRPYIERDLIHVFP